MTNQFVDSFSFQHCPYHYLANGNRIFPLRTLLHRRHRHRHRNLRRHFHDDNEIQCLHQLVQNRELLLRLIMHRYLPRKEIYHSH